MPGMPSGPLGRLASGPLSSVRATGLPASFSTVGDSFSSWPIAPVAPSAVGLVGLGVTGAGVLAAVLTQSAATLPNSATGRVTSALAAIAAVRRLPRETLAACLPPLGLLADATA